jgi:hypothetical protein
VTTHERAISWLADHIEATDAAHRRDVARTAREACREAGRLQRCLELLSLAAFALRTHTRPCDRPDAVWRQGVFAGAVVLLASLAAENAAAGGVEAGRIVLAAMLAGSTACALLSRRSLAVGIAAAAAIVGVVWVSHGVQAGAFLSACVVAIGGLLAGGQRLARPRFGMALALGVVPVGLLLGLLIGASSAEAASVLAFAWIAPAALLLGGWFDPRLAAAATTIVFARLAASGFGELGRALAVLQEHGQRALLLRWLAMGSSVVGAWLVTHRSIRRIGRL